MRPFQLTIVNVEKLLQIRIDSKNDMVKLMSFINENRVIYNMMFRARESMWLVIYRFSTVRSMNRKKENHMPTEWRMNATMLFIIVFVKFGNFFFKIERNIYVSMCEIGSLRELVEWSIQNKNIEKKIIGNYAWVEVSMCRKRESVRPVRLDSKTGQTWSCSTNVPSVARFSCLTDIVSGHVLMVLLCKYL